MRIVLGLVAVAALMGATAVQAASKDGAAVTLKAAPAKARLIQDGAAWICKDVTCVASAVKSQPALRACKRVASELGAVSAFTWRGEDLSADDVTACNTAAKAG
ncbi:CC_3452 family protein [Caulobacter sp. NIBR2454]|uniref:CC_3452 family protein n=1 Tax=Caulobacter sp. NIBR2454 TaxID=3015996 RepID=UPI0022B6D747|nr:hypothetical protein [Caulobacter sp. NIBR2454]